MLAAKNPSTCTYFHLHLTLICVDPSKIALSFWNNDEQPDLRFGLVQNTWTVKPVLAVAFITASLKGTPGRFSKLLFRVVSLSSASSFEDATFKTHCLKVMSKDGALFMLNLPCYSNLQALRVAHAATALPEPTLKNRGMAPGVIRGTFKVKLDKTSSKFQGDVW